MLLRRLRPAFGAAGSVTTFLLLSMLLAPAPAGASADVMPGDLVTVTTFSANFDGDNPNQPPNATLPGAPTGDYLTFDTSAGTITVVPSYDGLSRPVEIRQVNDPGQVMLIGHAVATPAPPTTAVVSWRSVAKDDEAIIQMEILIRASNGAILASVEYLHQGGLSYNASAGAGQALPVMQANRQAQRFTITADFAAHTTSLSIDGVPVPGFGSVPFAQDGDDIATVEIGGQGGHPQTVYADDISVAATYRVPDRAPTVTAPPAASGVEGSLLSFTVSASDPDGQAITSLSGAPLPLGAAFTPNASNTSGTFAWTPDFDQAGSYAVTFTASNALSGAATTNLSISNFDRAPVVTAPASVSGAENAPIAFTISAADPDGDAIASLTATGTPAGATFTPDAGNTGGSFSWTPGFAQSGNYSVTFTASNALVGTATTAISVSNSDRAPVVTAPVVRDGEEGGVLLFTVTAADPDGEAIGSLTADLSGLPAGNEASFVSGAGNTSGTFQWPMKRGEAGVYLVTFTASNGGSGSATTRINVAFAGTTVTGQFTWTPQPGQEGTYTITFSATNNFGEIGTATTTLNVMSGLGATSPVASFRSDGSNTSLAPGAIKKGPIVRAAGTLDMLSGQTSTTSATAADDGSLLAPSPFRAPGISLAASAIVTFDCDRSNLPEGNNSTWIVDQEPTVTAPASFTVDPGDPLSFGVSASDPDGEALFGLTADTSLLPAGNTAAFSANATFTSGTFAWTPRAQDAGTFAVTFTAFNQLVGAAVTTITVRAVAPADIFLAGPKKFRLSSNRPFGCLQIQPANASFDLLDVDPSTITMVSVGTGVVSEISANTTKSLVLGDRNNDQIEDMQVCFNKDDLRLLFSLLRGNTVVPVIVRGRLFAGPKFEGSLDLEVVAGGGPLQTVLAPNPLNPAGTLSFLTKRAGRVRVSLYDLNGRFIRAIYDEPAAAPGAHEVSIDGRGADRRALPSGVYFYRIESPDGADSGRFTILK